MMRNVISALVLLPVLAACDGRQASSAVSGNGDANHREAVFAKVKDTTCFLAIERYFVEEIGSHYVHGEHCVPLQNIVAVDERDTDDILVWGDFWVFNYNQSGDTLKCVSGGSHPGLIHLRQTGKVFEVTAFDQVGDGSRFLPTAKRIFGDKYEAFHAVNSDDKKRERRRAAVLADYVRRQGLAVTMYQDYGWPAKKIR
ncbi:MAG: hypothetical protein IJ606_07165 [Bacteroidaceae bacterium]|nr:hypothetical protein [Bacteroidaceae bacterium]